ncbi:post-segregation antitoxin CcdA [Rhizobium sp. Root274]|uniref:type II toxin-antitoxin system CcdA family antitoxin n=1 Tax=unclassified Rhizobium TaxID=2613769 RepID=UPI0007125AC9|nr:MULTISPECIES: type II toxin-antitoxin system CcdA family antitoxin [unclassified Rhizobium]KQW32053.1 post-segregation antitoxin CcdA [Rhizobium sp. Root1240]KRD33590.1 post-segregation antitoxin CcdA [Rhizobium sp. Root274]
MAQTSRKQGNGSIAVDERLLQEARDLKLDLSRAATDGIARAVKAEKERLWKIENAEAMKASNDYVEKHGLPLAKYRMF